MAEREIRACLQGTRSLEEVLRDLTWLGYRNLHSLASIGFLHGKIPEEKLAAASQVAGIWRLTLLDGPMAGHPVRAGETEAPLLPAGQTPLQETLEILERQKIAVGEIETPAQNPRADQLFTPDGPTFPA